MSTYFLIDKEIEEKWRKLWKHGMTAPDTAVWPTKRRTDQSMRAEREYHRRHAEAEISRLVDEIIDKKLEEMIDSKIVKDTIEANPQYNDRTREIVTALCSLYPKLNSRTLPGKELLIPFIFSIAYDIQQYLEDAMPEGLQ